MPSSRSAFRRLLFPVFVLSLGLFAAQPLMAEESGETKKAIDERINEEVAPYTEDIFEIVFWKLPFKIGGVEVPFILIWLLGAGIFLTIYFKFINFRSFGLALRTIRGRYSSPDDPGEITHFQALSAALSATVGLGNIAGVAIAISKGGPGATFWMILVGLVGMTTKFAECTLGVRYRQIDEDGRVRGGPMRYLRDGLSEKGLAPLGTTLAVVFAILCVGASLGGGNMFQVNQACTQLVNITGGEEGFWGQNRWIFGGIVAVLVALVIIGGIRRIASVTAKLVPVMCVVYIAGAIVVLLAHFSEIPAAFGRIFSEAFTPQAIEGGFIGVLLVGIQRAAFSNEAGIGSAPVAHAAVKTRKPASEGVVALLEPFIDTVVVCTMTALVIVVTGIVPEPDASFERGIVVTSDAFGTVISWFPYVLFLAVLFFAFSTLISWSYYGVQAWSFLFGKKPAWEIAFKVIFCLFIIVGSSLTLGAVTDFSDGMLLGMCFPNLIGVYLLLPIVKKELDSYRAHVAEIDGK